jgi:retron-type reverse transcriptase
MQSIAKVLSDMFNPTFSLNSYGYMPGRSVRQAAYQAQGYYQQGYIYQIDIDLEKFFDTVNHDILSFCSRKWLILANTRSPARRDLTKIATSSA